MFTIHCQSETVIDESRLILKIDQPETGFKSIVQFPFKNSTCIIAYSI